VTAADALEQSVVPQHHVQPDAAAPKPGCSPVLAEQQSRQSVGQQLGAGIVSWEVQQSEAAAAGAIASAAPAVDASDTLRSQGCLISGSSSSGQAAQAATAAHEGNAAEQAIIAEAVASADTVAEMPATEQLAAGGGQQQDPAVAAEHSSGSYDSDFDEEAATHQVVAAN
jgi:hypothetical protein